MIDIEKLIDGIHSYIRDGVSPLVARIKALEDRPIPEPVKDVPPIDLDLLAIKAAALVPKPMDGRDGKDGRDAIIDIDDIVRQSIALIPAPVAGRDGKDGANGTNGKDGALGRDGKDGADGMHGKDGAPGAAGQDGAPGRDGENGQKGDAGQDGIDGNDGKDGAPGRDGNDGTDGKDCDYAIVAKMVGDAIERAMPDIIAKAVALLPIPAPGRDGRDGVKGDPGRDGDDGFSPDDLTVESIDGGRTIEFTLRAGDRTITRSMSLAVPLDRGVFKAGEYSQGDGVTHSGSFWIAQRDTKADELPGRSDAWRLAVKRGQDAKA
jgi:hypothetical protein